MRTKARTKNSGYQFRRRLISLAVAVTLVAGAMSATARPAEAASLTGTPYFYCIPWMNQVKISVPVTGGVETVAVGWQVDKWSGTAWYAVKTVAYTKAINSSYVGWIDTVSWTDSGLLLQDGYYRVWLGLKDKNKWLWNIYLNGGNYCQL